jgi:hypothetical protein
MKAWKIEKLGGKLNYVDVPIPEVRPGSVFGWDSESGREERQNL